MSLALTWSCRQLHAECMPILYGRNEFALFEDDLELKPIHFSPIYAPLIRYLRICDYMDKCTCDKQTGCPWDVHEPERLSWFAPTCPPHLPEKCRTAVALFPGLQVLTIYLHDLEHVLEESVRLHKQEAVITGLRDHTKEIRARYENGTLASLPSLRVDMSPAPRLESGGSRDWECLWALRGPNRPYSKCTPPHLRKASF